MTCRKGQGGAGRRGGRGTDRVAHAAVDGDELGVVQLVASRRMAVTTSTSFLERVHLGKRLDEFLLAHL